ncbi:Cd(II)/Pb(II)-responsive transcriptional regulator [Marinobacter sp.]|jgi:Cd(II)/Pb(II)-responsive transcriptional regulator|uniref:Cd(II)/Pb(II)-responsive transcriptional regulator n=1 Tax=Marinobacter sp. TaxID=50741 RepID=UPI000C631A91|nr:Cd(II)/Pb(II)-responsive transcriptional regulator [Marinobacter sp.]MAO14279.1 Cd(II)/Pb(II)-responsive transcriptional regulator [Marinobacter sp.]|tara:strand:- start:456 stop:905 length:450 start_codon:yes stop_codon:yes gene_type:complete
MKIGELSKTTGLPVETIRYYEKIGLMPEPGRNASGYRQYRHDHLDRLLFIKRCRNLDMTQDEIRELIRLADNPEADCSEVDALLARHLSHVRERLTELTGLEQTLERLQRACSQGRTVSECGILGGLTKELGRVDDHRAPNHVPGTHRK